MPKSQQTSDTPTHDFSHLLNDLPEEDRHKIKPYLIEAQYLHIWQVKQKAVAAHRKHMTEINGWLANIRRDLDEYRKA